MRQWCSVVALALLLVPFALPSGSNAQQPPADPLDQQVAALARSMNDQLAGHGVGLRVGAIDLLTREVDRASGSVHVQPYRWVPDDGRRQADDGDLRYLVRQQFGDAGTLPPPPPPCGADCPPPPPPPPPGPPPGAALSGAGPAGAGPGAAQTEPAIDRAVATWQADRCVAHTALVKVADPGTDTDITDELAGVGDSPEPDFGLLFATRPADIVVAGFRPRAAFDRIVHAGGDFVIGLAVTYFYTVDSNNDGAFDTAFVEIYFNADLAWAIDGVSPSIDVQSVALHEFGHALGLAHFGPPPAAVMNPSYDGLRQALSPTDHAGMCTIWGSWPHR